MMLVHASAGRAASEGTWVGGQDAHVREDGLGEQGVSGGVPPLAQHTILHAPVSVCAGQTLTQNRPSTCANTSNIGSRMGSGPVKHWFRPRGGCSCCPGNRAYGCEHRQGCGCKQAQHMHSSSWPEQAWNKLARWLPPRAVSCPATVLLGWAQKSRSGFWTWGFRFGVATEGTEAWCWESTPPWEKNQKPGRHLMKAQWSRLMMPPLGAGQSACSWQGVLRIALNSLICIQGCLSCCCCCCCCTDIMKRCTNVGGNCWADTFQMLASGLCFLYGQAHISQGYGGPAGASLDPGTHQ